jgi:hypothetical protein
MPPMDPKALLACWFQPPLFLAFWPGAPQLAVFGALGLNPPQLGPTMPIVSNLPSPKLLLKGALPDPGGPNGMLTFDAPP